MTRTDELWNTASEGQVGELASHDAALASVRRTMHRHGASMIETLVLGYKDTDGEGTIIARR